MIMRFTRAAACLLLVTSVGCAGDRAAGPASDVALSPLEASLALVPLDPFGRGAALQNSPRCASRPYRQFDFWVGKWDVFGGPNLAGSSLVESVLDGCAMVENWTSASFGKGRSLNAYDASTGMWSQMWVGSGGCPFSAIQMEGRFEDGSMTLTGRKEQPQGFLVPTSCGAPQPFVVFARTDRFRWTALANGEVLQQFTGSNDDAPVPPLSPPSSGIGLRYARVDALRPLEPFDPSFCPARAAAKQFDFMLGSWTVRSSDGSGPAARATFRKDVRDCLVEETFTGPGGYEGMSFNTFDVFTQRWMRTYVDNQGQRLLLTGFLVNGEMVLSGTKHLPGRRGVEVRVTWRPSLAGDVVQRWAHSHDGGTTWEQTAEIVYSRS
jgi:hypothetical protein